MKFICPLIAVNDIVKARHFYESLLEQVVKYDFGENIEFEGKFSIHQKDHYKALISINSDKEIMTKAHNFELYFECEDMEKIESTLISAKVEFIHKLMEQPWGQRVLRVYDYDGHIVEIGESMDLVICRFYEGGMNVEEITSKTSMPVDYIKKVIIELKKQTSLKKDMK